MTCSAVGSPQTEGVSIAVHTVVELHAGFSNAHLGQEKKDTLKCPLRVPA